MKKKSLKRKAAKKARKSPERIDARIAAAKTDLEKQHLAMYDQKTLPSRIEYLVKEWSLVLELRNNPVLFKANTEMQQAFLALNPHLKPEPSNLERAQENGMKFLRDAMLEWDADAFIELGEEMKRETKRDKSYNLDHDRRVLLSGGVSTGKAAETILSRGNVKINWLNKKENEERQLKRIKARWRKGGS